MKIKMKINNILVYLVLFISIALLQCAGSSDSADDMVPEPQLENSYTGNLTLRFVDVEDGCFPGIDESTSMPVTIDKETGLVDISSGLISYDVAKETSVCKNERNGGFNINPVAHLEEDNGEIRVQIVENAQFQELFYYCVIDPPGSGNCLAQSIVNVTYDALWDGGLSFNLNKASSANGAEISVDTGTGMVVWKLILLVTLD